MTSLITNVAAMTALQTLQQTNRMLDDTQNRVSTGYRVESAADNAAYWSIATTMRSDNKALSAVSDALGLGAAMLDIAYTGLNSTVEVVDQIKAKLVAAREPGVDKLKIQAEIAELQKQLKSISDSASFSGENWLSTNSTTGGSAKDIVSSFTRDPSGVISISTIKIQINDIALFDAGTNATTGGAGNAAGVGILDRVYDNTGAAKNDQSAAPGAGEFSAFSLTLTAATTNTELDAYIKGVDDVLKRVTKAAADLGASKSRVDMQTEFVSVLMDAITRGVGTLVDADMTEESTKLKALQTQQQLGVQALSIANTSSQTVLKLFQG